jgi:hypothetical protein
LYNIVVRLKHLTTTTKEKKPPRRGVDLSLDCLGKMRTKKGEEEKSREMD